MTRNDFRITFVTGFVIGILLFGFDPLAFDGVLAWLQHLSRHADGDFPGWLQEAEFVPLVKHSLVPLELRQWDSAAEIPAAATSPRRLGARAQQGCSTGTNNDSMQTWHAALEELGELAYPLDAPQRAVRARIRELLHPESPLAGQCWP